MARRSSENVHYWLGFVSAPTTARRRDPGESCGQSVNQNDLVNRLWHLPIGGIGIAGAEFVFVGWLAALLPGGVSVNWSI